MLRAPLEQLLNAPAGRPHRLLPMAAAFGVVVLGMAGQPLLAAETAAPLPQIETRTDTPSGLPVPRFVSIKAPRANVRQGPSPQHAVVWVYVKKGIPVEVVAETQTWRRIRDIDGKEGWVHSNMLDGARTAIVVGKDMVALRRKPDAGADASAWAEPGLIAKLLSCDAAWCEIAAQSAKGWLPRQDLWGVLPGETFE